MKYFTSFFICLFLTIAAHAQTTDKVKVRVDLLSVEEKLSSEEEQNRQSVFLENLYLKRKVPVLTPDEVKRGTPIKVEGLGKGRKGGSVYRVGTGTRGGGSGIASWLNDGNIQVEVLDLYRSRRLNDFPGFSSPDSNLEDICEGVDLEISAECIFNKVLERMKARIPALYEAVLKISQDIPFSKWTAAADELPLIQDYTGSPHLNANQAHVQIAYRRANYIIYNREFYKAMNPMDRAALRVHEYLYALSGKDRSITLQRMVSLLFSKDFVSFSPFELKKAMSDLSLFANPIGVSLPKGVSVGKSKMGKDVVCGFINQMTAEPISKSVRIEFSYSPRFPHLQQENFLNMRGNSVFSAMSALSAAMEKKGEILLSPEDSIQYLQSLFAIKSALQTKFPIYLYPAQSNPADLICISLSENRVVQIQAVAEYHFEMSRLDLMGAELEAKYYESHAMYQDSPSPENLESFRTYEKELAILKNQILAVKGGTVADWEGSKVLEIMTFSLERVGP